MHIPNVEPPNHPRLPHELVEWQHELAILKIDGAVRSQVPNGWRGSRPVMKTSMLAWSTHPYYV